ncbi:MAG: hypothetical protein ACI9NC_003321, partial [Verrucomicrobiales bacterium]
VGGLQHQVQLFWGKWILHAFVIRNLPPLGNR